MSKILVTGAFGQIGSELVPYLQEKHGRERVVAMGNRHLPEDFDGVMESLQLPDKDGLEALIDKHQIDTIYHLVSLLSAKGEQLPDLTWKVNVNSLKDVLDLAKEKNLKVFWPSSIAAFGPTTPQQKTPQRTVLEPTTMYGVTKVTGELMCQYYHLKYGLDVRSVRYPGLISWKTEPGGGTTDYAVEIFYQALQDGNYEVFLKPETSLPMMYMDDAVRGTVELMEAPVDNLTVWTSYNFAALSFTPEELVAELKKHVDLTVKYQPDERQQIAESWPRSIDDTQARKDWQWQPEYDLQKMVATMVEKLRLKLGID